MKTCSKYRDFRKIQRGEKKKGVYEMDLEQKTAIIKEVLGENDSEVKKHGCLAKRCMEDTNGIRKYYTQGV